MPFNKEFRERQKRLREKSSRKQTQKKISHTLSKEEIELRQRAEGIFPSYDVYCEPANVKLKITVDKYGNYTRG